MNSRIIFVMLLVIISCSQQRSSEEETWDLGIGGATSFKIPLPPGYPWAVTQSWGEHCSVCDARYPDPNGSYCSESHTGACCKYGWDFSLPGDADLGKPTLATGDGVVKTVSYNSGWGNHVVIDHGGNICSRYAHLQRASMDEGDRICQGMIVGAIGTTGNSTGEHLHFQFEHCDVEGISIPMQFSDGNGAPECRMGSDVENSSGSYNFLNLSNDIVRSCGVSNWDNEVTTELPSGGWYRAQCGAISGCPMTENCGRVSDHQFDDVGNESLVVKSAASYLYSECVLDGRAGNKLEPAAKINRAEALKVSLSLFGLAGNCGASSNFADVNEEDWFFPLIACGVKYGIISTNVTYFNPSAKVKFSEAAKMLTKSADIAGVISIQGSQTEHFPEIPSDNWAYPYVETLYAYGGLDGLSTNFSPSRELKRGEFFVMAASLSPCYCKNILCIGDCDCNQKLFSCSDPSSSSTTGVGGEGSGDDEETEVTENNDVSEDDQNNGETDDEIDLLVICEVEIDNNRCADSATILYVKCSAENRGEREVKINNLILHADGFPGDCVVTDDSLRSSGTGTNNIEPGDSRGLTGHFEITCQNNPGTLNAVIDLVERISGEVVAYLQVATVDISIPPSAFDQCGEPPCEPLYCEQVGAECGRLNDGCGRSIDCGGCAYGTACENNLCRVAPCSFCPTGVECRNGLCMIDNWSCDPDVGYRLDMNSPGGRFEVAWTGQGNNSFGESFPPGMGYYVHFECSDLPAAIMVYGGAEFVTISAADNGPAFAVWASYEGSATLTPPRNPDVVTPSFTATRPDVDVLVRFPPSP